MRNRRQDRIIIKALLMSAGFLAFPTGVVAADGVDTSSKDVLEVQQEVDLLRETGASENPESSMSSESATEGEEMSEVTSTPNEAEEETSEKDEEESLEETDHFEEKLEEWTEASAAPSSTRPVSELLEEGKDSSSASEEAPLEEATTSEEASKEESGVLPTVALYSSRSAKRSDDREAPSNVVVAFQQKNGRFYDKTGTLIRDRWVEYQGEYYFPNAEGQLYTNRFIHFGSQVTYYMDESGMQYRGVLEKGNKRYLLDEVTARLHKDNAWVHQSTGDYFPNADGELYHDRFIYFGSDAYYMDENGAKSTGVVEVDDELYLLDEEENGKLRKDNAWVSYEGEKYFPNAEGKLYRGVVKMGDKRYLLDEKTARLRTDNAWVHQSTGDYFPNAKGELYHNRFITFGSDVAYYMNGNGAKTSGVIKHSGNLYLLDDEHGDGRLRKDNAWVTYKGKKYFPNAKGELYHDRFITFGSDVAYYMNSNGVKASGVVRHGGNLYLLDDEHGDGRLRKDNAWVVYKGKRYFPNAKGELYHDRAIFFGPKVSYYLGSDGTPKSGIYEWNGKTFFYDPALNNQSHTTPGVIRWEGKEYTVGSDGAIVIKEVAASDPKKTPLLYSLRDLQYMGVVHWGGYKFTYYSQSVLPGGGLRIPGRHVNEAGYVADQDGYIVLANSAPNGTVIPTPFGYYGKVYDSGTYGNHYDVYTV